MLVWARHLSGHYTLFAFSFLPSHWRNEYHELPLEDLHNYMIRSCGILIVGP